MVEEQRDWGGKNGILIPFYKVLLPLYLYTNLQQYGKVVNV